MSTKRLSFLALILLAALSCNGQREKRPEPGTTPTPGGKVKTYYIAPGGDDDNSGIAPAFAMKSFSKVLDKIRPGDIIKVMPGEYVFEGKPVLELKPEHSGTEGKYVTIMASDPANRPVMSCGGTGVWDAVEILASYVILEGLEFKGWNQQLDSLEALRNAEHYRDDRTTMDWNYSAKFNTNGIAVGGDKNALTTHVTVRNCVVHDFPGAGMGASICDYITFEDNVIYNNAWFCMYACSGISYMHPINSDGVTDKHKMIVRGNLVYNNRCMIPWCTTADFRLSDGNGIIMDINNQGPDSGLYQGVAYTARTLVANNVSIYNGGSGIHSFKADHVDIVNNTAYWNGRKYPENNYNEIFGHGCADVHIFNNVMIARDGGYCNNSDKGVDYHNNIYFGPTRKMGTGDIQGDPMVVKLSKDGAQADFHLRSGSPAIGHGADEASVPEKDKDGVSRELRVDCGAYQYVN